MDLQRVPKCGDVLGDFSCSDSILLSQYILACHIHRPTVPSLILVLLYDSLSQWDESGRSVTGLTVSDWGVGDGELTQVVANHLWLDLNGVENLTVVNTNQRANHLWDNNHVSQVGLDDSWLLVGWSSQLGGSQLGDETHWLGTQASGESSSDSGTAELGELVGVHLQKLLKVDALEGEGLEGSLPGIWRLVLVEGGQKGIGWPR